MIEVPEDLLEERRRLGADRWDEMWDGVLHMAPAPSGPHQRFVFQLGSALKARVEAAGLIVSHETEVYRPGVGREDYRIPDLVVAKRERSTDRGVEGRAELAVEVRSANDETYEKLPFYAEMEVQEVLVVDPRTCVAEMFVLGEGALVPGPLRSATLDIGFATVDTAAGPVLRLTWPGGSAEVHGRV